MSEATTHSVYVWAEHTSRAGHLAWPDLSDDNECMDDYTLYEGTADDLRSVIFHLSAERSDYSRRVCDLLSQEIA